MPFAPSASRILLPVPFLLALLAVQPAEARPQSAEFSADSVPILISDFELVSVPPPPNYAKAQTAQQSQRTKKTPPEPDEPDIPSVRARRLMDFFAATLVETLQKGGYTARRTRGGTAAKGALIRGVFAEPDDQNRIRRTLLGGTSIRTRFFLYVGIFNRSRPDQPLYQLAGEQPGGSEYGPVITLNSYVPLAKYELDKNPTEEDVRKICAQIAASLTALLAANPNAFAQ